jgi:preprotein translocase subunit SecD
MTSPSGSRDVESRLVAALKDTARRNLSDATPPPRFDPDSLSDSGDRPEGPKGAWVVVVLAAAIVVAVILAMVLPGRRVHSFGPAGPASGTFVTLRARANGLSEADLNKARQVISARAVALGAVNPNVQIVGFNEITAFLPGVAASAVQGLGAVNALQIRPIVMPWSANGPPAQRPSSSHPVVDPWKSLGFAPPKDAAAYVALSRSQQLAVQAVVNHWNCNDLPLDRPDAPIVTCDPARGGRYLLGPVLAARNEITSIAPAANEESIADQWELAVTLNPAATSRVNDYIAQFQTPEIVETLDSLPIADVLLTKPLTADSTVIATCFKAYDERAAIQLAAVLNAGALPAPFDVVSVEGR